MHGGHAASTTPERAGLDLQQTRAMRPRFSLYSPPQRFSRLKSLLSPPLSLFLAGSLFGAPNPQQQIVHEKLSEAQGKKIHGAWSTTEESYREKKTTPLYLPPYFGGNA